MAWYCSGSSNRELIENLASAGLIQHRRVKEAMLAVDRANYAPSNPYIDTPQPIGYGATISAPHMHAHALELLFDFVTKEGARILDVGCGSGYLTACLARLADENAKTYGIDVVPELVELARTNFAKGDQDLIDSGRVVLKHGNGWQGLPQEGPFDAIHVGAAAETLPRELLMQLKVGGRMVVPVGPDGGNQELVQVDRTSHDTDAGAFKVTSLMGVRFVPLVHEQQQHRSQFPS